MKRTLARTLVAATLLAGGLTVADMAAAGTPAHAACWNGVNKPYYSKGRVYVGGWITCNQYVWIATAHTAVNLNTKPGGYKPVAWAHHSCRTQVKACHARASTPNRKGNQVWCGSEEAYYGMAGGSSTAAIGRPMKCEHKAW